MHRIFCSIQRKRVESCSSLGNSARIKLKAWKPGTSHARVTYSRLVQKRLKKRSCVKSALYQIPSDLQSSIQTGLGIAWLLALPFSAFPILSGESKEKNEKRSLRPSQDESAENIRWSVMGVLSLVPFLNWLAWIFAALDDDDASSLYYTYAFLYALPYLSNGLQLDSFAALSILVGVAHVQIERIASTETAELELPRVARSGLQAIPVAFKGALHFVVGLRNQAGERVQRAEEARQRRPDRQYLEEKSKEARMELDDFDRRAREKEMTDNRDSW